MKNELKEKNDEIKKRDAEKIKALEAELKQKDNDMDFLKSMVVNAGMIIKTSANTLSHVIQTYPNAPTLESLKLLDYKTLSKKHDLTTTLASYYKDGLLPKYLCNILVKYYKTSDPKNQSFWASDVSRLTFITRIESDNEDPQWVYDMKGNRVGKSIIDPMLQNTKTELLVYIDETPAKIAKLSVAEGQEITDVQKTAYKLLDDINNGSLKKQLLKEMSPFFYLYDKEAK